MHYLFIVVCLATLLGTECVAQTDRNNDFAVDLITKCTAGILPDYDAGENFEADLNKAISKGQLDMSVKAEVNDWVRRYLFDKLPEEQAAIAYDSFIICIRAGGDP
jgi:hypothetical protein